MAKAILRLTNKSASIKISDAVETVTLATDLKLVSETLGTIATQAISSVSWVAGVVTVVTTKEHAFTSGFKVTIAGFTPVAYNGTYVITAVNTHSFTYALTLDPTAATVLGTAGAIPKVSMYRIFATGNFDITRNGVLVLKSTSGQQFDIDFSQMETIETTEAFSDFVVTPAAGCQVYILARKETGYIEGFQAEIYGSYDNPTLVTA